MDISERIIESLRQELGDPQVEFFGVYAHYGGYSCGIAMYGISTGRLVLIDGNFEWKQGGVTHSSGSLYNEQDVASLIDSLKIIRNYCRTLKRNRKS